jgi:hypothetical protein
MTTAAGVRMARGYVEVGLDRSQLKSGLAAAKNDLLKVGSEIRSAGMGLMSFGGMGLAALVPSILSASSAAEGLNRFNAVMGDQAAVTEKELIRLADTIGRYDKDLMSTASSFQGLFVGLGISRAEAAKLSLEMTELSLDFASLNQLADSDAAERFIAGLSGSSEVFDRFGINIKEAAIKAELAQMGITGTASELQKVQARMNIIRRSMKDLGATKDATNTRDSFENQMKALGATAKKASEEVGKALIPEIQKYIPAMKEAGIALGQWLAKNPEAIVSFGKTAAGITAIGGALYGVGTVLGTVTANWQALSAVIAVAAIAYASHELYIIASGEALKDFNKEMERSKELFEQLKKQTLDNLPTAADLQGKGLSEAKALVDRVAREAQGADNNAKAAAQQADKLATMFNTLTGNKVLAEARQHAEELQAINKLYQARATEMVLALEKNRGAIKEEQAAVEYAGETVVEAENRKMAAMARTREERQKSADAARTQAAEAQERERFIAGLEERAAAAAESARQRARKSIHWSLAGTEVRGSFSGAVAAQLGQSTRTNKTERGIDTIAKNTEQTVAAIQALTRSLAFG